jgi:hypothetical protein
LRALFLLLRGGLLLFLAAVTLYRCFWRPPCGVKSKRIFLNADLLLHDRSNQWQLPEVVLFFSNRLRVAARRTLRSTSSSKKSVSCVSAVLFLLCQSRFVLFLLGLALFILVMQ